MTGVHTVRPTDLVALVAYDGRVFPNHAVTRDRIGTQASPHPLETAIEQWFSFATGRHTWISVKGATLRGLVAARKRGSKAAWEVDCLIDAAEDDPGILMGLLEQVAVDAASAGAEKVFLRIAADGGLVDTVCSAGFSVYLREHLLARDGTSASAAGVQNGSTALDASAGLRRWSRADAYPTFRLYNRWTPEPVRRVEAPTFREWLAARERASPPRGTRQWVVDGAGGLTGWVRTAGAGDVGRFELMADPSRPEVLDLLVDATLARLGRESSIYSLVPEFSAALRERLERRGFTEHDEYVVLALRTARAVRLPELAPAVPAQTLLA